MPHPPLIVFTDLDGTLLDHDSYSPAAAAPALARLRAAGVPVVLASSKTAAEIAPLRAALGFAAVPAIVENGAGLLEPGADCPPGGQYDALRGTLRALPADLRAGFVGFADWGPEGIAEHTGLPPEEAARAARRQFSEPGLWTGSAAGKARFLEALAARGIAAREGGRFLTLSFGGTKAGRMDDILARYGRPFSVALGDAPNDVEMLERADLGIVVANPHRAPLPPLGGEAEGRIRRTTLAGPAGWNAAILQVMVERGL
ncbi:MAG: HAD-IIB family hydrolase [Paracoccaceae bacterium]